MKDNEDSLNNKLEKALKKLLTLEPITLKNKRSSHYNFGIEKPFVFDRLNIRVKLSAEIKFSCHIVFDSAHYGFPPDVIFHNLPELEDGVEDRSVLLPAEDWNLDQEDCLYDWFQRILTLMKKPEIEEPPALPEQRTPIRKKQWSMFDNNDEADDDFQDDFQPVKKAASPAQKKTQKYMDEMFEQDKYDLMQVSDNDHEFNIVEHDAHTIKKKDDDSFEETNYTNTKSRKGKEKIEEAFASTKLMDPFADYDDEGVEERYKEKTATSSRSFGGAKSNMASIFKKYRNSEVLYKEEEAEKEQEKDDDVWAVSAQSPTSKQANNKWPISDHIDKSPAQKKTRKSSLKQHQEEDDDDDGYFDISGSHPTKVRKTANNNKQRTYDLSKTRKATPTVKIFDLHTAASSTSKHDVLKEWRRKFITEWVSRYNGNVMGYDTRDFLYCSFHFQFSLSKKDELWAQYSRTKQVTLADFISEHKDSRILKFKPEAPIIVNFKLNKFSTRELEIKLISVTNTTEIESSEPDTMDLDYDLDDTKEMSVIVQEIMHFITTKVAKFHYQLEDHHPTYILD